MSHTDAQYNFQEIAPTDEIHNDDKDIHEDDVCFYATNMRKFEEVNTRRQMKKNPFGFYR